MTKEEREAYVRQICKDKNYTEEKTLKAIAKAHAMAEGEDGAILDDVLSLPIKSSADYNSKVDELKGKAKALDAWHQTARATVSRAEQAAKDSQAKLAKFEAKYGDVDDLEEDDDGNVRGKGGKVVDEKTLTDMLAARDRQRNLESLQIIADSGDIVKRHFELTGKIISTRDLLLEVGKAASDSVDPKQISINDAYDRLYGKEVESINEKRAADEKTALKAEGAKEERARLQRAGVRLTGAAVSESTSGGIAFDAINSEGKKDDKTRQLSEDDRLALFEQELRQETDKHELAEAANA